MRLELRRAFECANIKFIWIFERYLSLVWEGSSSGLAIYFKQ